MMQPSDIRTTFGKGLFGYKKADVDSHIDVVSRAYDDLFKEVNKLREENERLNKVVEENRVKIFELEKLAKEEPKKDNKKSGASSKVGAAEEVKEESNTSKFFKQAEEDATVFGGDDDEVFVGEIEDNRKTKSKVMIGDGEEESADDFEFL